MSDRRRCEHTPTGRRYCECGLHVPLRERDRKQCPNCGADWSNGFFVRDDFGSNELFAWTDGEWDRSAREPDESQSVLGILNGVLEEEREARGDDLVDHPSHYGGADNPYEAIKVIEAWELGFHLGNAVKYIARAGRKDPSKTVEDLRKARWYLDREIERLEGK